MTNDPHAWPAGTLYPDALGAPMSTPTPTQVRKPWHATARTLFQVAGGLTTLLPLIALGVYQDSDAYPAVVAQVLAVSAAFARVMAMPKVNEFLARFLPFLAAQGKQS